MDTHSSITYGDMVSLQQRKKKKVLLLDTKKDLIDTPAEMEGGQLVYLLPVVPHLPGLLLTKGKEETGQGAHTGTQCTNVFCMLCREG
jgi:hypothetical protein